MVVNGRAEHDVCAVWMISADVTQHKTQNDHDVLCLR